MIKTWVAYLPENTANMTVEYVTTTAEKKCYLNKSNKRFQLHDKHASKIRHWTSDICRLRRVHCEPPERQRRHLHGAINHIMISLCNINISDTLRKTRAVYDFITAGNYIPVFALLCLFQKTITVTVPRPDFITLLCRNTLSLCPTPFIWIERWNSFLSIALSNDL